ARGRPETPRKIRTRGLVRHGSHHGCVVTLPGGYGVTGGTGATQLSSDRLSRAAGRSQSARRAEPSGWANATRPDGKPAKGAKPSHSAKTPRHRIPAGVRLVPASVTRRPQALPRQASSLALCRYSCASAE